MTTEPDFAALLDDGAFNLPSDWPPKEWVPVARDRVGDIGAVTCLQRVTAHSFFSMTTVYTRQDDRWIDAFENGEQWPEAPTSARPGAGRPFALLTGTSGAAVGTEPTNVAFTAGVVTSQVRRLRVISRRDEHDVCIDNRTGIFVALSLHWPDSTMFRLAAFDGNGEELDHIDYRDPWS